MKKQANTTHFFYQNGKLVTVSQGGQQRNIFRGADIPLAEQNTNNQNPELLATDRNTSVLAVHGTDNDEEPHCYTAYGHNPSLPSKRTTFGFNGERAEPILTAYILGNGYRLFNPKLMRFISPDDWSPFEEGGINAYCYCLDDPINNTDPNGHRIVFTATWKLHKIFRSENKFTNDVNGNINALYKKLERETHNLELGNKGSEHYDIINERSAKASAAKVSEINKEIAKQQNRINKKTKNISMNNPGQQEKTSAAAQRNLQKRKEITNSRMIYTQPIKHPSNLDMFSKKIPKDDQYDDSYYSPFRSTSDTSNKNTSTRQRT